MEAIAVFGITLVLMGAAFAIPTSAVRSRAIRDRDAPVLGAAVLELGLGTLNLAALVWFAISDDISASAVGYGILPLIAAALGLRTVLRKLDGMPRSSHLLAAVPLTLLGFPGYFAPQVAALATAITAVLYLAGLIRDPRTLLRTLDPRN
jgi:EamA domain-containing membrane protein RarD